MKQLLLISSMFILMLLPLSNQAQVSGSNGNRFIINAGITPDMFGFYITPYYNIELSEREYKFGKRLEFNYIFQRNKSIGLMLDFNNAEGQYGAIRLPDYSAFPYEYEGSYASSFPIKSTLIELTFRFYNDGQIAPLGNYIKLMGGILVASHEFDVDKFKAGLEHYYDPNEHPNPSDVEIPVQDLYASPYVGFGIGESFPLYENLFLDLGANFRFFLTKNAFGTAISQLFEISDYRRESEENNNHTKENMVGYEVVGPPQIPKTLNMNISLRYTF